MVQRRMWAVWTEGSESVAEVSAAAQGKSMTGAVGMDARGASQFHWECCVPLLRGYSARRRLVSRGGAGQMMGRHFRPARGRHTVEVELVVGDV